MTQAGWFATLRWWLPELFGGRPDPPAQETPRPRRRVSESARAHMVEAQRRRRARERAQRVARAERTLSEEIRREADLALERAQEREARRARERAERRVDELIADDSHTIFVAEQ